MNTKTTITFKTEKKLRDAAKRRADQYGLPLTTVLNAQLAEFVRSDRFELTLTPRPEKLAEWAAISREYKEHPERFIITSAEEFIADLKTQAHAHRSPSKVRKEARAVA